MNFFVTLVLAANFLTNIPFVHAAPAATPRIANIFLSWNITRAQAVHLSRWDIVVLDAEVGSRQKHLIALMRARNPQIKIFAYISANEIHTLNENLTTESPLRGKLQARLSDELFLKDPAGARVSFWKSAHVLNPASEWKHILPQYIHEEIMSAGVWDGIMLDNVWDGVTWYVDDVDMDRNNVADVPNEANAAWKNAMHELIGNIRAQAPNTFIIGNGSTAFTELDGIVFENFPRHGWDETIEKLREFQGAHNGPSYMIINANANNNPAAATREAMQFGLASALLTDAFFSFDLGDQAHASHWWYPEYMLTLGAPISLAREVAPSMWQRNFEHATILINTHEQSSLIVRTKNVQKFPQQKFPFTLHANVGGTKSKERVVITNAPYQTLISVFDSRNEKIHSFVLERERNESVAFSVNDTNRDGIDELIMQHLNGSGAR